MKGLVMNIRYGQSLKAVSQILLGAAIIELLIAVALAALITIGSKSLGPGLIVLAWGLGIFFPEAFACYLGLVLSDIHGYFLWAKTEHDKRSTQAPKPTSQTPPQTRPATPRAAVATQAKVISGDLPEGWKK